MATQSEMSREELPPNIILKDNNNYFCTCCSCILGGVGCMKQHVAGKRHKKEMQRSGLINPPQKETVQTEIKPIETPSITNKLPSGIVESPEKWNSFLCIYCSCVLNAGDVNLHVGGKRHTKRANQAALENFFNQRGERNDPKLAQNIPTKIENSANFQEVENESESQKSMSRGKQIPESSTEELNNEVANCEKITRISPSQTNVSMKTPSLLKIDSETKSSIKVTSETSINAAQQANFSVTTPQVNASVKINSQTNSSVKIIPQTNASQINSATKSTSQTCVSVKAATEIDASIKSVLQAGDSVTAIPQRNASIKSVPQVDTSVKVAPQTSALVTTALQATSSENISQTRAITKTPQTNASVLTSERNASVKIPQTISSIKTSQSNALVKIPSQTNAAMKDVPQIKSSVKATPQTNASVKAVSQISTSQKSSSQINTSVKATLQRNVSSKTVPQINTLVKSMPQTNASVKSDPQKTAPLQITQQLKSSLNDYLATASNSIVGLNYVVEIQLSNEQSRFQCNLCKVNGDAHVIKDHVNSTKHHLEYLKTVDPIKAAEVRELKESERTQKILELVTELERKKGRGTILVKTAEMKQITDNESDIENLQKSIIVTKKELQHASTNNTEGSAIQIVAQEFLSKNVIRNAQRKDQRTSKIIKELINDVPNTSYIMHDDILYERRNGKYRVVVAHTMKQAIYESYHFSLCRKTPGAVTYINDSYSWSGINEDITKFAKQCYVCQIRKLRQLANGEAIPILVRRGQGKRIASPTKRTFIDLTNEEIEDTQRWDPETVKLITDIENGLETNKYIVYAKILYTLDENGQYKIVVSPQMKKLIFEKNHSVLCWKSTERPPIINAITQVYFWQRMLEEVKLFAAKCKKCRTNIPVKRISDQKISTATSGKMIKKSSDKGQDTETKDAPKDKMQDTVTKDTPKEKNRDEMKEKSPKNVSWDKTKSLKPPIVEQNILTKDMIRDSQKMDINTSKIIKLLMDGVPSSNYILYEGVLYQEKNGRYLTMVADRMKQTIYEKCHSSLCSRYTGRSSQRDGTKYINRHFSWPAISQDIYIFVKNCHVCQVRTLRTKAFSRSSSSDERHNNKVIISTSRPAFNDLTDDEISTAQRKDPDTLKLLNQIEDGVHISRHILYEDILYCQGGHGDYKVVITSEMKATIYQNNHSLLCWESTVWQSTVDMISQVYLWPRIHEDIRDFMESCQVCKREFTEQSYIDAMTYPVGLQDGSKLSENLMEQYPTTYSDAAYCSSTQQYQSNYPVQSMDPYTSANSAAYPYNTYPQYWNTSSDSMVTYPTISSGTNYWESSTLGIKEEEYSLNSGKRPATDDVDSDMKKHSCGSYSQRKRQRADLDTEYEYSRLQSDTRVSSSYEAQKPADQNMALCTSQFQHSPVQSAAYHSEFNKPKESENSSNTLGFTITNAEDAEITLDIINSLMHIYLKYQLKKLHGPVQKLLQESLKAEEKHTKLTSHGESAVSGSSDATDSSANELFVRLPRLHKSERTDVKQVDAYSVKTSSDNFHQPAFGQPPYNQTTYTPPISATFKSDKSSNIPFNSKKTIIGTSFNKKSNLPKTSSFVPNRLHSGDNVDKSLSIQNDDIDGFPMITETDNSVDKASCNWEDDIDGKPLITESSSKNTECNIADSIDSTSMEKKAPFGHLMNTSVRTSPSLNKHLQNKDDSIDGVPLGFKSNKLFDKSQSDLSNLSITNKTTNSSNKSGGSWDNNKNDSFLKPDTTKIFKKPPDDWDKNANKTIQSVKGSSFMKPQINWSESNDDVIPDTKTLSDKYPNWKKSGIQSGTSFYNSPLYNKESESGVSTSSTAPVIDLFKRYRRVQL